MKHSGRVGGIQIKATFQSKKGACSFVIEKITKKVLGNTWEYETVDKKRRLENENTRK